MADGTIKQVNPFTDNEVWSVPGRSAKPVVRDTESDTRPLQPEDLVTFCSFCQNRIFETPPEKSRLITSDTGFRQLGHVRPSELDPARDGTESDAHRAWLFRRVPNLFEIVTVDYWKKNYGYKLSKENLEWKDMYLADPRGRTHVLEILDYKLRALGMSEEKIAAISDDEKFQMSDAFFGGSHELIMAAPHFRADASTTDDLYSSSTMTADEHYQYFKFTVDAMTEIFAANRYIRYISVFQNWLAPAGASFDHLHKQLVGIDDWGASIRHQLDLLRQDPNIYNELSANLAAMHNLVFAENESAIAFAGIGHRHPTIEIFSKSYFSRPYEHSDEEIRGVSDLVHACHAATGGEISSNEEWYYTPIDAIYKMPWHVMIKWRVNTAAGFEGGTSIYINPLAPMEMRDRVVPKLYELRNSGKIASSIRIAEECRIYPNPLRYYLE